MALKTRQEYLAALKKLQPNMYKFGERIEDVTTHPATRRVVESHARAYDAAHDPAFAQIFTTPSVLTGEKIHRHNSLMQSAEDVIFNSKLKREMYRLTGTCTGALCAGWNGMNTMWAVTQEIDGALGTDYHERLKAWARTAEKEGLTVSGALTDAKGNRSLKASQQPDLDANVRIVEERKDGIVLRGAKLMICGVAASRFRRRSGSVFDGRTWTQASGQSRRRPSVSLTRAPPAAPPWRIPAMAAESLSGGHCALVFLMW